MSLMITNTEYGDTEYDGCGEFDADNINPCDTTAEEDDDINQDDRRFRCEVCGVFAPTGPCDCNRETYWKDQIEWRNAVSLYFAQLWDEVQERQRTDKGGENHDNAAN
jgi:hypothetical protein